MGKKRRKITHPKKRAFLAAFAEVGNITQAAEIAKIERKTHYVWMGKDENYVLAFEEAQEQAADRLEQEARRRAMEGTLKPVFYKGEECGVIREYSDTLLIFLMKGARPEKYKERISAEHTGKDGGPIEVKKYEQLDDAELDRLIIEKLAAFGKTGIPSPD